MNRKTAGKSLDAEDNILLKEYLDAKAKQYDIAQLVCDHLNKLIKAKSAAVPE